MNNLQLSSLHNKFVQIWVSDPLLRSFSAYCIALTVFVSNITTSSPGYSFLPGVSWTFLIEITILFCIYKLIPKTCETTLQVLQVIVALFLTIPSSILVFHNQYFQDLKLQISVVISLLIVQYLLHFLTEQIPRKKYLINRVGLSLENLARLFVLLVFVVVVLILMSKGLEFRIVNFTDIYVYREKMRVALQEIRSMPLNYAMGFLTGLIPGILMGFYLLLRKKYLLILSVLTALLAYISSFQKGVIASLFLVVLFFLISRGNSEEFVPSRKIFNFFNGIIILSFPITIFAPSLNAADLMVRRPLLDPSIMYQYYLRFSTEFPSLKWSDISIPGFETRQSVSSAGEIIGDRYFYSPSIPYPKSLPRMNATSGAWADSLAQFGIFGLILTTILVFAFFYTLQLFSEGRDIKFAFILTGLSATLLMEGTLHTSMLSRGLILVPILMLLLENRTSQNKE